MNSAAVPLVQVHSSVVTASSAIPSSAQPVKWGSRGRCYCCVPQCRTARSHSLRRPSHRRPSSAGHPRRDKLSQSQARSLSRGRAPAAPCRGPRPAWARSRRPVQRRSPIRRCHVTPRPLTWTPARSHAVAGPAPAPVAAGRWPRGTPRGSRSRGRSGARRRTRHAGWPLAPLRFASPSCRLREECRGWGASPSPALE